MGARDFGFSQYCTPMWPFEEDLQHFRAAGATCMELCEGKLQTASIDRQVDALRKSGLRVSSVQPLVPAFFPIRLGPTTGSLEGNRAALQNTVDLVGKWGIGDRLNTVTGVIPGKMCPEALPAVAAEYRELCRRAAGHGIRILIEPENVVYCGIDSMISTLAQAAELVDAVDQANMGFTLDVWHVWQRPEVYQEIERFADRTWTVHINDWKPIRCAVDRYVPGAGEIPLGKLFRKLDDCGYDNGYVVEFFSGNYSGGIPGRDAS